MNSKEEALVELVDKLGLETRIKGILDLCRGTTLFELFYAMINEEEKDLFLKDYALIHEADEEMSYESLKLRNLEILIRCLSKYSSLKGIDLKRSVVAEKIAYDNNMEELKLLIKNTFAVLIEQKQLIQLITTLSKETQRELMEIFQEIMSGDSTHEKNEDFLEKISELESQIEEKDQNANDALQKVKILSVENDELREQISVLRREVEEVRKKNESLEQVESLFHSKDSQIQALNEKNQELKLASMRLKQEHQKEICKLQKTIDGLNKTVLKYQTESELQRLKNIIDDKGKALEESNSILVQERNLLKKVRERCTVLENKNKDLEDLRLELSLKIEEKEMEKETLTMKLDHLEERMKDEEDQRESIGFSFRSERKSEVLGIQVDGKFNDDSSIEECTSVQCQQQRQELGIYKNKCLELIKNNEILRGNSANSTDRSFDKSEEISSRLSSLTTENIKLKEKVANLSSQTPIQQAEQALTKQKSKFNNLKKKVNEDQESRNKEAELMMSAMCEMVKLINENISSSKVVEILRKLK